MSSNDQSSGSSQPIDTVTSSVKRPQSTVLDALKHEPQAPQLHQAPRRSPFGALLSRTLPNYHGEHPVGICDIEVPVKRQTFGNFHHKSLDKAGEAGLVMDTVMFSLFYPVEMPEKPQPVVWFPRLRQTIDGFLRMAQRTPNFLYRAFSYPIAAAAILGTTFPAHKDAPLKPPPEGKKWPMIVFSHGVGCSRLMYSAFCGEMASRGYIVAAIEHRDGTSPSSRITAEDGTTKVLDWLQWSDLHWPDEEVQPTDDTRLRHDQIDLRVAEIFEVVEIITKVSRGESIQDFLRAPTDISSVPPESALVQSTKCFDWSRWNGAVDVSGPVMAGHSLGGGAGLAASARKQIPFSAVVVFDPAVQRLEPWTKDLPHPLLVVNSEEFAVGKEYAIFAEQVAGTALHDDAPQVFSIPGATHPSFSDVFLILPETVNKMTGLRVQAERVLQLAVNATESFLKGEIENIKRIAVKYKGGNGEELKVVNGAAANSDTTESLANTMGEQNDNVANTANDTTEVNLQREKETTTVPKPSKPVGDAGELVWHPF